MRYSLVLLGMLLLTACTDSSIANTSNLLDAQIEQSLLEGARLTGLAALHVSDAEVYVFVRNNEQEAKSFCFDLTEVEAVETTMPFILEANERMKFITRGSAQGQITLFDGPVDATACTDEFKVVHSIYLN